MRIEAVELLLVHHDDLPAFRFHGSYGSDGTRDDLWIRVVTESGIDGWSPVLWWGTTAADIASKKLRQLAIGEDALAKERLWERVWELDRWEELPIYMIGALDTALWDITAKAAGLPLHRVLGGYRDRVPAYASFSTFDGIAEYLDVVDQCRELGFRAIKLKGHGDRHLDAALCAAVRSHVGDEFRLMFDGFAAYDVYDALWVGRALEDAGFTWYEEPIREVHLGAYRQLAQSLDIPLLVGETLDGAHFTAAELLATGAADIVRTGFEYRGITGSVRVAHVADAFGRRAEVHNDGLPNLHLCCALRNCPHYELSVRTNPVEQHVLDSDGCVAAPMLPGIGFEPQVAEIERRAERVG